MEILLNRREAFVPYGWRQEGLSRPARPLAWSGLTRRRWPRRAEWWSRRRRLLRLAFFFVFLVVFLLLSSRLRFFEVKTVVCDDGRRASGESPYWCPFLQSELLNRSFFFPGFAGVQRRFGANYPEFSRLTLQRSFPSMVKAHVKVREPLAFVVRPRMLVFESTPSAESLIERGAYLIDEEGYLFRRVSPLPASLPYLYDNREDGLGQKSQLTGAFWRFSLRMLAGLQKLGLKVVTAEQNEKGLVKLFTDEGLAIYLSSAQEVERQLAVLQLIIEKYKIEGKRLREIDLRFKEPVVGY